MAEIYQLKKLPGISKSMLRAITTANKKAGHSLPSIGYSVNNIQADLKQLSSYCHMFDYKSEFVPSSYWYMLLFKLQTHLMLHPDAPYPILGMVHLNFIIKQYRPVLPHENLNASCYFGKLYKHDKGTIVETIMTLKKDNEIVWKQKNYNLYRTKSNIGQEIPEKDKYEIISPEKLENWNLKPKDALNYAKISGDYNPIHLNKLLAKAFGFPKQVIHGWYTFSKALSPHYLNTPDAHEIHGAFKKPLFLPARVINRSQRINDKTVFDAINGSEGFPHLKGHINKL